jgi:hypothetical protein
MTDIEQRLRGLANCLDERANQMRGDPEEVYADAVTAEEGAVEIARLRSDLAETVAALVPFLAGPMIGTLVVFVGNESVDTGERRITVHRDELDAAARIVAKHKPTT